MTVSSSIRNLMIISRLNEENVTRLFEYMMTILSGNYTNKQLEYLRALKDIIVN